MSWRISIRWTQSFWTKARESHTRQRDVVFTCLKVEHRFYPDIVGLRDSKDHTSLELSTELSVSTESLRLSSLLTIKNKIVLYLYNLRAGKWPILCIIRISGICQLTCNDAHAAERQIRSGAALKQRAVVMMKLAFKIAPPRMNDLPSHWCCFSSTFHGTACTGTRWKYLFS